LSAGTDRYNAVLLEGLKIAASSGATSSDATSSGATSSSEQWCNIQL
jgi:hypothetical protein